MPANCSFPLSRRGKSRKQVNRWTNGVSGPQSEEKGAINKGLCECPVREAHVAGLSEEGKQEPKQSHITRQTRQPSAPGPNQQTQHTAATYCVCVQGPVEKGPIERGSDRKTDCRPTRQRLGLTGTDVIPRWTNGGGR
ncbi:hypothetical protein AAFF_G00116290 [Aldrovandia affinis]|uniref:Uncharacterized protein n=1 Tax=Aldrovandia affinis TaxID=143900 RepID=A0AAD7WXK9_9TELE|nr:hypothetical protein AAFF_G00116290 [Aldrovandia affinis]